MLVLLLTGLYVAYAKLVPRRSRVLSPRLVVLLVVSTIASAVACAVLLASAVDQLDASVTHLLNSAHAVVDAVLSDCAELVAAAAKAEPPLLAAGAPPEAFAWLDSLAQVNATASDAKLLLGAGSLVLQATKSSAKMCTGVLGGGFAMLLLLQLPSLVATGYRVVRYLRFFLLAAVWALLVAGWSVDGAFYAASLVAADACRSAGAALAQPALLTPLAPCFNASLSAQALSQSLYPAFLAATAVDGGLAACSATGPVGVGTTCRAVAADGSTYTKLPPPLGPSGCVPLGGAAFGTAYTAGACPLATAWAPPQPTLENLRALSEAGRAALAAADAAAPLITGAFATPFLQTAVAECGAAQAGARALVISVLLLLAALSLGLLLAALYARSGTVPPDLPTTSPGAAGSARAPWYRCSPPSGGAKTTASRTGLSEPLLGAKDEPHGRMAV